MPFLLGGLLAGFGSVIVAMVWYGMHSGSGGWLQPFIQATTVKHGFLWRMYLRTPVPAAIRAGAWLFHKTVKAMGDALGLSLTPLVHWLTSAGTFVWMRTNLHAQFANQVATGMLRQRKHVMPAVAKQQVAPVKAAATHAGAMAGHALQRWKAEQRTRQRSIDRIHKKWLIPLALLFKGIDNLVRHKVIPRINAQSHLLHRVIPRRLARINARLKRLERITTRAAIAAVVVRVIARRFPWLFCRNVKRLGARVCGMHSDFLNVLLGLGVGMFVFSELCRFIEQVAAIAARVVPKLIGPLAVEAAALCDGEHSAAASLPLQTTALPDVPAPLGIA